MNRFINQKIARKSRSVAGGGSGGGGGGGSRDARSAGVKPQASRAFWNAASDSGSAVRSTGKKAPLRRAHRAWRLPDAAA